MLGELRADVAGEGASEGAAGAEVARMADALQAATTGLLARAAASPEHAYWVAGDYLRAVTLVLMAWGWARIDRANVAGDARWSNPSHALRTWVLPEFEMRLSLLAGASGR